MKPVLLFSLALIVSCFATAQDIEFTPVRFSYMQLPLKQASKQGRNFSASIDLAYLKSTENKKLSIQEQKQKAEEEYKKAQLEYEKLEREARRDYADKIAAWDKLTVSEKLNSTKPQRKVIPLPYKKMPVDERYMTKFDTATLAMKYLSLEGFERNPAHSVKITVTFHGFECSEPKVFEKEHTKLSGNHQVERFMKYRYVIHYRHPASFKVESPDGVLLMEEFPADCQEQIETGTPEFENKETLEKLWSEKKEEFLKVVQQEVIEKNLKSINERVNQVFGYRTIPYTTQVGFVDEKNNYHDLKLAATTAVEAYNTFARDLFKGEAQPLLLKALELWENAYKESDTENKKARIDKEVSEMILINMAEACMWLDDYTKAKVYLNKVIAMDPPKKILTQAENIGNLIPVLKERYELNRAQ